VSTLRRYADRVDVDPGSPGGSVERRIEAVLAAAPANTAFRRTSLPGLLAGWQRGWRTLRMPPTNVAMCWRRRVHDGAWQ
jgi:hypothetical protein